ncbi:hypothetical protein [Moorena sp. SIO3I6]|uniref:hypothetical protein n=1 Tax=Moorena sp. SIO3I6 TaxID=2607831 RepID=UPI0013FC41FB|nr:hypothetical protein [Moorena sp. SIO3I6]NEP24836.1 hypothetical protein [Moorena sp. SIO3I6]
MNPAFEEFLNLPAQDRNDVFESTADIITSFDHPPRILFLYGALSCSLLHAP